MSLDECLTSTSHRQFRMWMAYFDEELNEPSRSDYYLMQNTLEIRGIVQAFARSKKRFSLRDFVIQFAPKKKEKKRATPEQRKEAAKQHKARWFGMLNLGRPKNKD